MNAEQIVDGLNDVQVVAMVKRIGANLAGALPRERLTAAPEVANDVAVLTGADPRTMLDPVVSVQASRRLLEALAADPGTAALILQAWAEVEQDDSLFIETIVALGLIANLTLFLATSDIKVKVKGIEIKKSRASADVIRAVLEPIFKVLPQAPGG